MARAVRRNFCWSWCRKRFSRAKAKFLAEERCDFGDEAGCVLVEVQISVTVSYKTGSEGSSARRRGCFIRTRIK